MEELAVALRFGPLALVQILAPIIQERINIPANLRGFVTERVFIFGPNTIPSPSSQPLALAPVVVEAQPNQNTCNPPTIISTPSHNQEQEHSPLYRSSSSMFDFDDDSDDESTASSSPPSSPPLDYTFPFTAVHPAVVGDDPAKAEFVVAVARYHASMALWNDRLTVALLEVYTIQQNFRTDMSILQLGQRLKDLHLDAETPLVLASDLLSPLSPLPPQNHPIVNLDAETPRVDFPSPPSPLMPQHPVVTNGVDYPLFEPWNPKKRSGGRTNKRGKENQLPPT